MVFDAIAMYEDYNVEYKDKGHKHCRRGWVQVECPFCTGNPGYHLGFNLKNEYFVCYRCGFHKKLEVIVGLLQVSWHEARDIKRRYTRGRKRKAFRETTPTIRPTTISLPLGTKELGPKHIRYLEKRGYDVDELVSLWKLKGTGVVGRFKFRIVIPIFYEGKLVSFTCRDITGKAEAKYKACNEEDEIIRHKEILYGIDHATTDRLVLVEGPPDVWRLGPGSGAGFGIKLTDQQMKLIASRFKRVFFVYDAPSNTSNEEQAQKNAELSGKALSSLGVECELIELESGDPGELTYEEAKYLMKELS